MYCLIKKTLINTKKKQVVLLAIESVKKEIETFFCDEILYGFNVVD